MVLWYPWLNLLDADGAVSAEVLAGSEIPGSW